MHSDVLKIGFHDHGDKHSYTTQKFLAGIDNTHVRSWSFMNDTTVDNELGRICEEIIVT